MVGGVEEEEQIRGVNRLLYPLGQASTAVKRQWARLQMIVGSCVERERCVIALHDVRDVETWTKCGGVNVLVSL